MKPRVDDFPTGRQDHCESCSLSSLLAHYERLLHGTVNGAEMSEYVDTTG